MVGIFDFTDPYTYGGILPATVANSQQLKAQQSVVASAVAVAGAGLTIPVVNGSLELRNQQHIDLPEVFRLPSTAKKFAFCVWAAFPKTGWPTGATSFLALGGCGYAAATQSQYHIKATITSAGVISELAGSIDTYQAGGAVTTATVDTWANGLAHQFAIEIDGESVPGSATLRLYIDGVVVATSYVPIWDGVLNVPDLQYTPRVGFLSPFLDTAVNKAKYRRAWLMTPVVGGKTIAAMVAEDYADNAARFV
jgi:hypothetical protein